MSDTEQALRPEVVRENAPPPKKYGVFLLNDDYTPMDFVVGLLTDIFRLPENHSQPRQSLRSGKRMQITRLKPANIEAIN